MNLKHSCAYPKYILYLCNCDELKGEYLHMGLKLQVANFNERFKKERVITNEEDVENGKFTEDGIFSEKIFGKFNDINRTLEEGWIEFGDYYIINPILYPFLSKVIPNLKKFIQVNRTLDVDGEEIIENEAENIGLIRLHNEFDEILRDYGVADTEYYTFIMNNYDRIFVNKFPIIHSKIRPGMIVGNTVNSYEVNDIYKMVVKYAKEIRDYEEDIEGDLELTDLLFNLQENCNAIIMELINSFLRKKKGFFRNNCLGTRINYSARNIITPLVGYRIDEVALPYLTYLELYKKQLINIISRSRRITKYEAKLYWREATLKFDKDMYEYMVELNEKTVGGQYILINRNPTISVGSIIRCKIGLIKTDYNDKSMSISNNLLPLISGEVVAFQNSTSTEGFGVSVGNIGEGC